MKDEKMLLVLKAILKHGDRFWNGEIEEAERDEALTAKSTDLLDYLLDNWNGWLFEEIVDMVNQDGYDLKLVKLQNR